MSKSNRLRLADVRTAFRLVGECRDFGHDPTAWNGHLVRRLSALFGCYMTNTFVATHPVGGVLSGAVLLADDWPDSDGYQWWLEFIRQEGYRELPSACAFSRPFTEITTARREEIIPNHEWRNSAERNEIRGPCGQDEFIYSAAPVAGAPGRFLGMSLNRELKERQFTARERDIVALVHEEIAALIGTRLVLDPNELVAGLTPRLRQVLNGLLEGDTEPQLALRLGLSRHTVHEYVGTLYRRFGVRARTALLRACLRNGANPSGG